MYFKFAKPKDRVLNTKYWILPMKYTQTSLDKLESIPEQAGYVLRYERGTFQSGYCILEERKVVVFRNFEVHGANVARALL